MTIKIERRYPKPKMTLQKYRGKCNYCHILFSCNDNDISYSISGSTSDGPLTVKYCYCPECGRQTMMEAGLTSKQILLITLAFFMIVTPLFIVIFNRFVS